MEKSAKIFVAGHGGLAGSAIVARLRAEGYDNLLLRTRAELDLLDQGAVRAFFAAERPEYVFLAAAKVGGIHANNTYPAEFLYENLTIQANVIHSAYLAGVRRLLFLGSSCIYPRLAPQPMQETDLLTGELEPTNEPYAIAKIAGLKMCEAYNRQYGTCFVAVMPTNLYGPGDNFHPENSHVLPALIRRFHEARLAGAPEVIVWGSGRPLREFLYIDEMADGSLFVMNLDESTLAEHLLRYPRPCFVNLGSGVEVSIRQLAETVREVVGYGGRLTFDASKPDGAPRKLLDVSAMKALGWEAKVSLRQGVEETYAWFLKNVDRVRG
ncbi:GDP-L-fucose synthase family protein [Desulfuromonas soudanensis]